MEKILVITCDEWETIAAIIEKQRVTELFFERKPPRIKVGNIYLGKAKDVLPGIQASFIDIGYMKNAFLFFQDAPVWLPDMEVASKADSLKKGQHLLVQLTKHPMSGKGARVTTEIALAGKFVVYLPHSNKIAISRKLPDKVRSSIKEKVEPLKNLKYGFIVRTAASQASTKQIKDELIALKRQWRVIDKNARTLTPPALAYEELDLDLRLVRDLFTHEFDRCIVESPSLHKKIKKYLMRKDPALLSKLELDEEGGLFNKFKIGKAIDEASNRIVKLRSGGYIAIDHTEALTAIDVNTGKYIGKHSLEQTIVKTNLEAADEIARQLRLRDLGGIIVIDYIGMKEEKSKNKLFKKFQKALESDRSKTKILGLSSLGLIEMTRKSVSESPIDFFYESCSYCGGTGSVISAKTSAIKVRRAISDLCRKSQAKAFLVKIHPIVSAELGISQGERLRDPRTKKDVFVLLDIHLQVDGLQIIKEGNVQDIIKSLQVYPAGQRQLL